MRLLSVLCLLPLLKGALFSFIASTSSCSRSIPPSATPSVPPLLHTQFLKLQFVATCFFVQRAAQNALYPPPYAANSINLNSVFLFAYKRGQERTYANKNLQLHTKAEF